MSKENLTCEICACSWQREQARGRKPRLCPNCLAAPETASKAPRIVIEDSSLRRPTLKAIDTTVRKSKYVGKNSWHCPRCKERLQTFIGLLEAPTHQCKLQRNACIPLLLVREQEV